MHGQSPNVVRGLSELYIKLSRSRLQLHSHSAVPLFWEILSALPFFNIIVIMNHDDAFKHLIFLHAVILLSFFKLSEILGHAHHIFCSLTHARTHTHRCRVLGVLLVSEVRIKLDCHQQSGLPCRT